MFIHNKWQNVHSGGSDVVYGMGVVGGLIYTIMHLTNFSGFLWGVIHSLLWPAFFVYKAFELLKF